MQIMGWKCPVPCLCAWACSSATGGQPSVLLRTGGTTGATGSISSCGMARLRWLHSASRHSEASCWTLCSHAMFSRSMHCLSARAVALSFTRLFNVTPCIVGKELKEAASVGRCDVQKFCVRGLHVPARQCGRSLRLHNRHCGRNCRPPAQVLDRAPCMCPGDCC
jgi:hypothetical protein